MFGEAKREKGDQHHESTTILSRARKESRGGWDGVLGMSAAVVSNDDL
jgi:hypothetical protein